jgi:type IV pilus assembly protein PilC
MAQFAYRARDARGGLVSGVLVARTQEDVVRQLRQEGKSILSVVLRSAGGSLSGLAAIRIGKSRVKQSDVVHFASQLAVMVDSGVPIAEALDTLVQQTVNPTFQDILRQIAQDVEGGEPLSEALEKHPKQFNPMFVSLVRAGESSGHLGQMLNNVSEYLVESYEAQRKIIGTLTYPIFLLCLAVIVVVVLMTVVLPKFTKIFASKGATLPLPTRMLMGLSGFVTGHWLPLVLGLIVVIGGAVLLLHHPAGRRLADRIKIRAPLLGAVCLKFYIARAFRALGTMIASGVPVITALEIARRTAGNEYFRAVFDRAIERVSEGETLADQFFCTDLIPVTTSQMVFAGEKAGRLGDVLLRVSGFCDRELKDAAKRMTTMLEPLLIVFMGVLVGGIAISLLLPLFTISRVMTR